MKQHCKKSILLIAASASCHGRPHTVRRHNEDATAAVVVKLNQNRRMAQHANNHQQQRLNRGRTIPVVL
eukprot:scaffold17345_cov39-Cyclotella_meneghiniana.AAC.2